MSPSELVEYVARSLADYPDEVRVTTTERDGLLQIELRLARSDVGRIIGREGRYAQALRTLVGIAAARQGKRATLDIG